MPVLEFTADNLPTPGEFRHKLERAAAQSTPIDELLELMRELVTYEQKYGMSSITFYERFQRGELGDNGDFIMWAGKYQVFLRLKQKVASQLEQAVAA